MNAQVLEQADQDIIDSIVAKCSNLEPGDSKNFSFDDGVSLDWVGSHLQEINLALNGETGNSFFVYIRKKDFKVVREDLPCAVCS